MWDNNITWCSLKQITSFKLTFAVLSIWNRMKSHLISIVTHDKLKMMHIQIQIQYSTNSLLLLALFSWLTVLWLGIFNFYAFKTRLLLQVLYQVLLSPQVLALIWSKRVLRAFQEGRHLHAIRIKEAEASHCTCQFQLDRRIGQPNSTENDRVPSCELISLF